VLRGGAASLTVEEVREHCRSRLASYKVPQRVVVVDEFPRNSTGKIHKQQLRGLLGEGAVS
jgi:acyl-CoA synthetase (AMP-forming)/AMP-acid ligase II